MEVLKSLDEITMVDPRQSGWRIRAASGATRPYTLEEHYSQVAAIAVAAWVPIEVQTLFNTARNVWLYSWYVYRFSVVAELQAFSTLEFALRMRFAIDATERNRPSLSFLLGRAVDERIIRDEHFEFLRNHSGPPIYTGNPFADANLDSETVLRDGHAELLRKSVPRLRNILAHGSTSVWATPAGTFIVVRAMIDALWDRAGEPV